MPCVERRTRRLSQSVGDELAWPRYWWACRRVALGMCCGGEGDCWWGSIRLRCFNSPCASQQHLLQLWTQIGDRTQEAGRGVFGPCSYSSGADGAGGGKDGDSWIDLSQLSHGSSACELSFHLRPLGPKQHPIYTPRHAAVRAVAAIGPGGRTAGRGKALDVMQRAGSGQRMAARCRAWAACDGICCAA